MPDPIALCLEYLDTKRREDRYLRCVALPGYDIALGLDTHGEPVWRQDERIACELWVSADDQLIIVRRDGSPETVVSRAGRSLSLPADKPVVLLDCDRVEVGTKRLRVHVHGTAAVVHEPAPLEERTRPLAAIAAAVAISASAIGCKPSQGAHETPSAEPVPIAPPSGGPAELGSAAMGVDGGMDSDAGDRAGAGVADGGEGAVAPATAPPPRTKPPLTVRTKPPKPMPPPRDGGP